VLKEVIEVLVQLLTIIAFQVDSLLLSIDADLVLDNNLVLLGICDDFNS
jgi:hypothetical protein